MVSLVLTIIGQDRVGVVESLARVIASQDGSWVESRMAQLAGKFAGLLRVEVPRDRADALCHALDAMDLHVVIERVDEPTPPEDAVTLTLEVVGADHPGIVRDIASALASRGVSIEELETECVPAPMTGEPLFTAEALLRAPRGMDIEGLEELLERLANDLMVEVRVEETGL